MPAPRRALIVIDAQREYFEGALPIRYPEPEVSVRRIRAAMEAALEAGVPIVLVQHEEAAGAPGFAAGSALVLNHAQIAAVEDKASHRIRKQASSVFGGTGLADWLREHSVDTITLAGYMSNNCVLASAVDAEPLGLAVEVLSDATGAIDLVNEAGRVPARQVHETLMALLHSNWAAVATTDAWSTTVQNGEPLRGSNLVVSAQAER